MIFELDPESTDFPNPELANKDGLLAVGGDLSPQRLVSAYASGVFPWFNDGEPYLWWSLDPRMVLFPSNFVCSKTLRRRIRKGDLEVRIDTCFEQVMRHCAETARLGQDGTWITDEMVQAYTQLHQLGLAHSFETFQNGELVGGLYGVSLGDCFFGESMFHTVTDASKVATARLAEFCLMHNFRLIDAQQETHHLGTLGAKPIPRKEYLELLDATPWVQTLKYRWPSHTVVLLIGGNQGDRQGLIESATHLIGQRIGRVSKVSTIRETEPWGFECDQMFLNQALLAETDLGPIEVLDHALSIEQELGRVRKAGQTGYASRPMDIDLIFYDSLVMDTPRLTLPHPRMHLRKFVLDPLTELMPNFIHPILKTRISEIKI